MLDALREIAWFKAATKNFKTFPEEVRAQIYSALNLAATGEKGDSAKPIKGMGARVFEIALKYQKDAYRVVYAVKIGEKLWVVHAFKKKSKSGIKTPKQEIDLIKARIKFLKEQQK